MELIKEFASDYGLMAAIVVFFIIQNQKERKQSREDYRKDIGVLADRLNAVEDYVKNTLVGLVSETKSVLEDAIDVLKRR